MQLIAECTYAAMYAMRDPKGKNVKDLFPFLFEEDDDGSRAEITDEEMEMLRMEEAAYAQNLIADFNAHQAPAEPQPEQSESTTR